MDAIDVESDFKKSRAFLLTYSTLLLLLWYFSVDLRAFSFLGVSIGIRDNIQNVHLVAALGNLYLLIRFFQKSPRGCFKLNEDMISVFESVLKTIAPYAYIRRLALAMYKSAGQAKDDVKLVKIYKQVTMGHQLSDDYSSILKFIQYRNPELAKRTELSFDISFSFIAAEQEHTQIIRNELVVPNIFLVRICQLYALTKGSFTTSWFTDYILPVLYALLAIILFVNTWWQRNAIDHAVFKDSFNQMLISI
ncbi:hypothetical protein [Pseudomonas sp. PDM27]|uniref:hypothetical protein n=1 Tax=Pseudomonas sp. PDM27 TaxID=2854769 RepID=UPI001C45C176|nr:hypothetical protein [Pseudomonas sp. PDM27]MBV7569559.1 hypothetical protein [Pseudomonas sp. PDM27]